MNGRNLSASSKSDHPRKVVVWDFDGPINLTTADRTAYSDENLHGIEIPSHETLRCTMHVLQSAGVHSILGSQRIAYDRDDDRHLKQQMFEALNGCFGETRDFLTEKEANTVAKLASDNLKDDVYLADVTGSDKTPFIKAASEMLFGDKHALRPEDFILVDDNKKYAKTCHNDGYSFIHDDISKSPFRAEKRNIDHLGEILVKTMPYHDIPERVTRFAPDNNVKYELLDSVCRAKIEELNSYLQRLELEQHDINNDASGDINTTGVTYGQFLLQTKGLLDNLKKEMDKYSPEDLSSYLQLCELLLLESTQISSRTKTLEDALKQEQYLCSHEGNPSNHETQNLSQQAKRQSRAKFEEEILRRPLDKESLISLTDTYTPSKALLEHIDKNQERITNAVTRVRKLTKGKNPNAVSFLDKLVDIFKSLFTKPKPEHAKFKPATVWFDKCGEAARKPQHSPEESPAVVAAH